MTGFETVRYKKEKGIAYVRLNRPEVLNTFNIKMRDELYQVFDAIRDDDEVRVAILHGAGEKAFCAGADLNDFLRAPSPIEAREVRWKRDLWGLFLSVPQPLIAAVHGYVLGSGFEMALCCDIRIASEDTRFGLPEGALGIIPAAGGTQTLPRTISRARALEMLLLGEWISGQEALDNGLINRLVPDHQLIRTAEVLAGKIASYQPYAVRLAKEAVMRGLDFTVEAGQELERRLVCRLINKANQTA